MRRALVGLALLAGLAGCASHPTMPARVAPPARPTGVFATPAGSSVQLGWSAVAGATAYHVYGSVTPGVKKSRYDFMVPSSASPATCTGLTRNVAYYFVVTAIGPGGESAESDEVSATPTGGDTSPVTATAYPTAPGAEELVGRFDVPAGFATTAEFEYGTTPALGSTTTPELHTTAASVQIATNVTGLTESATYYYRLRTSNSDGVFTGDLKQFRAVATPATVAGSLESPQGLLVQGGFAYWADDLGARRAPVSGGGAVTIGAVTMAGIVRSLALDGASVFWSDGSTIWSAPLAGGAATPLASGRSRVSALVRYAGDLYWRDDAGILKTPAAGGAIDTVRSGLSSGPLRVDDAGLWWGDHDRAVIEHAPLGGGSVATIASVTQAFDLVHDGGYVYWTDATGIYRAPDVGGAKTQLGEQPVDGSHLVVDGGKVYWVAAPASIVSTDVTTRALEILGLQQSGGYGDPPASEVAVDPASVYWIVPGRTSVPPPGVIVKVAR
jgi:hypothetical protein